MCGKQKIECILKGKKLNITVFNLVPLECIGPSSCPSEILDLYLSGYFPICKFPFEKVFVSFDKLLFFLQSIFIFLIFFFFFKLFPNQQISLRQNLFLLNFCFCFYKTFLSFDKVFLIFFQSICTFQVISQSANFLLTKSRAQARPDLSTTYFDLDDSRFFLKLLYY